jgi:hypothetical protein
MEELFNEQQRCLRIYIGRETVADPYEKNVTVSLLPPIPIKGIVTDLVFSQIQYKMPGIVADEAKEILIEKRHRTLLEKSQKIQIDNKYYTGWRVNHRMQIREEGNYLRAYIYSKKND